MTLRKILYLSKLSIMMMFLGKSLTLKLEGMRFYKSAKRLENEFESYYAEYGVIDAHIIKTLTDIQNLYAFNYSRFGHQESLNDAKRLYNKLDWLVKANNL